jgi:4-diphosphocytidyl-2-C-methyl-D-erythritol kinase
LPPEPAALPPEPLVEAAPAKINLTLRVIGRRGDGYHDIDSLVAFASLGDRLTLATGGALALTVAGPNAAAADADNLVLKAARALAERIPGLRTGTLALDKQLPVAAGLGGGSADAAAALRLLARANGLTGDDPRVVAAARATGADVPVCLDPRVRVMRGIGEVLSTPLALPPLPAVLANPGIALPTKEVFAAWKPGAVQPPAGGDAVPRGSVAQILQWLGGQANDLENAAIALKPPIADMLAALRALAGCRLGRMSGSGATCFALFDTAAAAQSAATRLGAAYPHWWVRATELGDAPSVAAQNRGNQNSRNG